MTPLPTGVRVRLSGFQKRPEYNGRVGTVIGPPRKDGRVPVRLVKGVRDAATADIWVKRESCTAWTDATEAQPAAEGKGTAAEVTGQVTRQAVEVTKQVVEVTEPAGERVALALEASHSVPLAASVAAPTMTDHPSKHRMHVVECWLSHMRDLGPAPPPFTVAERAGKGRCVVAVSALPAGTALPFLSGQAPFAAVIVPSKRLVHCAHCCRGASEGADEGAKLLPCPSCGHAYYCSIKCMQSDAPLHRHQCACLSSASSAVRSLELKTEEGSLGPCGELLLASRCLWHRYLLLPAEALDGRMFDALETLPTASRMEDIRLGMIAESTEDLLPPGASATDVVSQLVSIRINAFTILDHRQDAVAAGCYPAAALLNHSCAPSVILTYEGSRMTIRTLRDVRVGEELCHSYIELCQPAVQRQQKLRDSYGFDCKCNQCTDPAAAAIDAAMASRVSDTHDPELKAARDLFDRIDGISPGEALVAARRALGVIRQRENIHSLERYGAESVTMRIAEGCGDEETVLHCGRAMLVFLARALAHVPAHPLLSMLRQRLSESEAELGELRVAMDMVEKSSAALMISHGAAHPLYREAAIWLKDLKETAADADDGVLL